MLEQGFLKSHFVGRDGFIWWIGQVAPKDSWKQNFNDGSNTEDATTNNAGWGERYRVRIMGYHTANKNDLPDNELPFATVMYPVTGGSGGGGAFTTSNITAGSFVYGWFLDGEDAQQPCIMGIIGYNDYQKVMQDVPDVAFKPFYGTEEKPGGGRTLKTQSNTVRQRTSVEGSDTNLASSEGVNIQRSYVVGPQGYKFTTTLVAKNAATGPEAAPNYLPSADPNKLPTKGIQIELQKAIQTIETLKKSVRGVGEEQIDRIENIQELINAQIDKAAAAVAKGIKWVYEMIEQTIFARMDKVFLLVFSAAHPNERETVKTTTGGIMDKIACLFRKLFKALLGMTRDFIAEAIEKVINVPTCFVEKFVGNTLGMLSGVLNGAMESVKSAISGVTDFAIEGLDIAGDVMDLVSNVLSFLNCDDDPDDSTVDEWSHINGAGGQVGRSNVANIITKARDFGKKLEKVSLDDIDTFDFADVQDFGGLLRKKNLKDDCSTKEVKCGPPTLELFGSKKGSGAAGNLIINKAGQIIGVDMFSFGVGYDKNARANFRDNCGKGKGAVLRPVFGDVNNQFQKRRRKRGRNKGTPASAPEALGFGNYESFDYPFNESTDDSIRREPFSPTNKAFGTPAFGLGPSFSKLGKRADKSQLRIRDEDNPVPLTVETFTIPIAKNDSKDNPPNVKFVLLDKTGVEAVDTDFDFTPEDIAGTAEDVRFKDGQVVVGKGKDQFEIAPKKEMKDEFGNLVKFKEAFEGGNRVRIVKGRKYLVKGFQFDGEPILNPLKISNDGKCLLVDDVVGRKTKLKTRQIEVVANPTKAITFTFGHNDADFANKMSIPGLDLYVEKKEGYKNKYQPESITLNVETGREYTVFFESQSSIANPKLMKDGREVQCNDNNDDDFDDMTITMSEGRFYDLKRGGEGGNRRNVASAKFFFEQFTKIDTVFVEKENKGRTNNDYDDLVVCAKRGFFKTPSKRSLKDEGALIYVLPDETSTPGDDDQDVPLPIGGAGVEPVIPVSRPSKLEFPSGGGGGGGIPGILTPLPGNRSTFHPFPGTTTLGSGKWVPGPIPPGGGGPHVGPAIFVHDGELFGLLTNKQGSKWRNRYLSNDPGSFGGGGGPDTPDFDRYRSGGFNPFYPSVPRTPIPEREPGGFNPGRGPRPGGINPGVPGPNAPGGFSPGSGGGGGGPTGPPPGGIPGFGPGTGPGGLPGTGPGGFPGTGPGSFPGTGPGSFPGTGPGSFPGTGPGSFPGDGPGTDPGTGPGDGPRPGGGKPSRDIPPPIPTTPPAGPIGPIGPMNPGPGIFYPDVADIPDQPDTPNIPGTIVPPDLGGFDGPGIGIIDVIVEDPGSGFLGSPDGSTGGDGRTYSEPDETRLEYQDGTREVPARPGTRICVDAGDIVTLPPGTQVITEPFNGEGGGELIVGGAPHTMQKAGCFTTPPGGESPPLENTYPVLMYLCDVIIKKPGFNYKATDEVVIEPSMGAEGELIVDKFGRISDVLITKGGEGFQEIPKITISSMTGQDASLSAKLCVNRVSDVIPEVQEKVIQVVDCVGKF